MLKVKKGNKVYKISEAEKTSYLANGYDVIDENGNVTEHALNSTVPYSEYIKVVKELEELKAATEKDKKGAKSAKEE